MELTFLGGAREVGRSAVLAEGKQKILLDCGIKMAKDEDFPLIDNALAKSLDSVVVSHAHLDHSGYVPALFAAGYEGKVILTKPTRDLCQLLLADALRLQKNFSPYNQEDINTFLKNTEIVEYNHHTKAEWPIRFQEAGHILGSAITEVFAEKKIIYSGDINTRASRLLEGAVQGLEGEVLVLESTYGRRTDRHPSFNSIGRQLIDAINSTLRKGGKVIIPTFAIGRGQEILFTLENYLRSGGLHKSPIFLDGMITKALRIYRHNAVYLKREIQQRILTSDDDPFKSEAYLVPQTKDKSDVLEKEEAIILCTSGMLNGGPVLTYLKKLGNDRKNKIILVGFQAKGSRGRLLLEGAEELEIDDEKIPIRLEVAQAPFSGHSDHPELVNFARSIKGLKKVFVVHGEGEAPFELAEEIEKRCKGVKCEVPELGSTHEL